MDDKETYRVVVNHEEQYSIWPQGADIPAGWRVVGPSGAKDECLQYIKNVWTDMRPRSVRSQMDAAHGANAEGPPPKTGSES